MGNKQMDYLSDEELMRLIQETEGQEMLMAPSYLKSEIMTKLAESEKAKTTSIELEHSTYEIAPVQGGEILPIEGNKKVWSKKKTLMIYQFKVAAVATAAIFALFVMPMGNNRSQMPQIVVGVGIILLGKFLIDGKKRELYEDTTSAQEGAIDHGNNTESTEFTSAAESASTAEPANTMETTESDGDK